MHRLYQRDISGICVWHRNVDEFERIHREIFQDQEYFFKARRSDPTIVDCGAHIGLAVLYFKSLYPEARIVAIEPDRENIEILRRNIMANQLNEVKVIEGAAWTQNGYAAMYQEANDGEPWTWGNTLVRNIWGDVDQAATCRVRTIRLSSFIESPVDYLKMDIEGAEEQVLQELVPKLELVREIRMEFHGTNTTKETNSLERIVRLLEEHAFTIHVCYKDICEAFRAQTIARVKPVLATIAARRLSLV